MASPVPWDQNPQYLRAVNHQVIPGGPNAYIVPRRVGRTPDDVTTFHAGQADWSKNNLPSILYQLTPAAEWKTFKHTIPPPLLDRDGNQVYEPFPDDPENARPMRDMPILPDIIGSQEEEWYFEAVRRLDPRVRWVDFVMRMKKQDRPDPNALQWRLSRGWRQAMGIMAWHITGKRGKSGVASSNDCVLERLSTAQKNMNTTRGLTPGLINPLLGPTNNWVEWPTSKSGKEWGLAEKTTFTDKVRKEPKKAKKAKPAAHTTANTGSANRSTALQQPSQVAVPPGNAPTGLEPLRSNTAGSTTLPLATTTMNYQISGNGYDSAREAAFAGYTLQDDMFAYPASQALSPHATQHTNTEGQAQRMYQPFGSMDNWASQASVSSPYSYDRLFERGSTAIAHQTLSGFGWGQGIDPRLDPQLNINHVAHAAAYPPNSVQLSAFQQRSYNNVRSFGPNTANDSWEALPASAPVRSLNTEARRVSTPTLQPSHEVHPPPHIPNSNDPRRRAKRDIDEVEAEEDPSFQQQTKKTRTRFQDAYELDSDNLMRNWMAKQPYTISSGNGFTGATSNGSAFANDYQYHGNIARPSTTTRFTDIQEPTMLRNHSVAPPKQPGRATLGNPQPTFGQPFGNGPTGAGKNSRQGN